MHAVRSVSALVGFLLVLAACGSEVVSDTPEAGPDPSAASTTTSTHAATERSTTSMATNDVALLPRCEEVGSPEAPADWYRASPIYVGNEMPVDEVRVFAGHLEGYTNIWIDRKHNGWVTVGFVGADLVAHQAELEAEFPNDGVVAVEMPYTVRELAEIQGRLQLALPGDMNSHNVYETRSVVEVWAGELTPERVALVAEIAAGDPVCVSGWEPGDRPPPGPQAERGEGWIYLAEFDETSVGEEPLIIGNAAQLSELWTRLGGDGSPPEIDLATHVVGAFEIGHSGSCPETRFDAIEVADDLVYAVIVHISSADACTADYIPRAYLAAIERDLLPPPPFQLSAAVDNLHRTIIDADLRIPNSAPSPDDVGSITVKPPRTATPTPLIIEPGYQWQITIDATCGIGSLGEINSVVWNTADGSTELPESWAELVVDGLLDIEILITEGTIPTVAATAGEHTVEYVPGTGSPSACP